MILIPVRLRNRKFDTRPICVLVLWVLATILFGVACPAFGSDDLGSQELSPETLSSQSFTNRQRTTMEWWGNREASREAVQRAARDSDPEISERAKWILQQWRRGMLPDTPVEIARLLKHADDPRAIEQLMLRGHFSAAAIAIQESAGTIDHDAIHRRLTSSIQQHFPVLVSSALKQGSLAEWMQLVDTLANTDELVLCRVRLLQRLGEPINEQNLLPPTQESWSPHDQIRRKRLVMLAIGKNDELLKELQEKIDRLPDMPETIDHSESTEALFNLLILSDRWQETHRLTKQQAELAEQADADSQSDDSYGVAVWWARAMYAATRNDDSSETQDAVDALIKIPDPNERVELLRWRSFAINGDFELALKQAPRLSNVERALTYLAAARPHQAIQSLDYEWNQLDEGLPEIIEQAVDAQMKFEQPRSCDDVKRMIALIRIMLKVGRENDAYLIASTLSQIPAGRDGYRVRHEVLRALSIQSKNLWIRELAILETDKTLDRNSQVSLQQAAGNANALAFDSVRNAILELYPQWTIREQVLATYDLLSGDPPTQWNPKTDDERLLNLLLLMKPSLFFVRMFSRLDRPNLSQRYLDFLEENADPEGRFLMAENALKTGRIAEAETRFRAIEEGSLNQATALKQVRPLSRFKPQRFDPNDYAKAVVGLYAAAKQNGDRESASERLQQIRWMLCAPSISFRRTLAKQLASLGLDDLAMSVFQQDLTTLIVTQNSSERVYDWALSYGATFSRQDPIGTAKWFDLAMLKLIESDRFYDRAYFSLTGLSYRWNLNAAIKSGDKDAAARCIKGVLTYDPLDLVFAEKQLPLVREQGWNPLADQALAQIIETASKRVRHFPQDATTSNNVAWVVAISNRELETALKLAVQAVRCQPELTIYRDTLAEVLFRLGRVGEAIKIEEACLLDSPNDWHVHQQIKRFKSRLD